MSIRILSTSEARTLLGRYPEITPESIPSYGIRFEEDFMGRTRDYLIGLNCNSGEVKIFDISEFDVLSLSLIHI